VQIVDYHEQTIIDIAGEAIKSERHPIGTVLELTGEAITLKKYGVRIGPSNDSVHLKGKIGKKNIWVMPFYLTTLQKNGNPDNMALNQLLGLEELNSHWRWSCINK